jgi:transcriptional regulator with XRE-family HTH domain
MSPKPAHAFGSLLRHWRSSRKVSQLALALDAGVSQRHLSCVETGRAQPSREMVLLLAEALDVPLRERNALLRAAGYADVYAESQLDSPALQGARRAIAFVLERHEPHPAFLLDMHWNVLSANSAAGRLMPRFLVGPPRQPLNVMRMLFDGREVVENFDEVAAAMIQRLHREALGTPEHSPARKLLAELDVPRALATPDLSRPSPAIVPIVLARDGLRLSLFSLISTFGTPLDVTLNELRLETFFPADDATAETLRALAQTP